MLLISISKYVIYIGKKETVPENLPVEVRSQLEEPVEVGAVRPVSANTLEERKHPEVKAAKDAMEETLDELFKK